MNGALVMGDYSWASIMKRKREHAHYRVTLKTPSGHIVVKTFSSYEQYSEHLDNYLERQNGYHDVEVIKTEILYR